MPFAKPPGAPHDPPADRILILGSGGREHTLLGAGTVAPEPQVKEHRLYPAVLQWLAEGHVAIADGVARVASDG